MSKYRRAAKIDRNQPEIVKTLRSVPNMTVEVGHDDILVGYKGKTYWFEIKEPDAVSKRTGAILDSKKKETQIALENNWQGHYRIVSSFEEILKEVGL